MIRIDGSTGEGGGQVLRTALSLSAITGEAISLERIRVRRPRPGLMRQHLTCARAVAAICDGELTGAELQSQSLTLKPGRPHGGEYRFAIGSAGSVVLLAQAILPVLLFADGPSSVLLEGGTHVDKAPSYEFFERTFLPCVRRMGAEVESALEGIGFYPAGGGRMRLSVKPTRTWRQLSLTERGKLQGARVTAVGSGLNQAILDDELRLFQAGLGEDAPAFQSSRSMVMSPGSGNILLASLAYEQIEETFGTCGSYGVSRESVAKRTSDAVRSYLRQAAPVGPHLADQLLLPMALGAGGSFLTGRLTLHTETNLDILARFLDVSVTCRNVEPNLNLMEIQR